MKAVFIDNKPQYKFDTDLQRSICEKYNIQYAALECRSEDEVIQNCQDADAVFVVYTKITKNIINALDKCKVYVRFGIGYDAIDVDSATEKGVMVCNVPDYCIEEVATHSVALILDLCRKVTYYNSEVKNGTWSDQDGYQIHRISNMTIGLIGFGNIARKTAGFLSGFGCKLVAYDPYQEKEVFIRSGVEKKDFNEVLSISDIVSLHVPLTDETYHIINKDSISIMKDQAMIVNTSRGSLISEKDLIEAINSAKIKAAALDVLETEPPTDLNSPVLKSNRIILTPHAASISEESRRSLLGKVALNACRILCGDIDESLRKCIVNYQSLEQNFHNY